CGATKNGAGSGFDRSSLAPELRISAVCIQPPSEQRGATRIRSGSGSVLAPRVQAVPQPPPPGATRKGSVLEPRPQLPPGHGATRQGSALRRQRFRQLGAT